MNFLDRVKAKQEKREANKRAWAERQKDSYEDAKIARERRQLSLQAGAEGLAKPGEGQVVRAEKIKVKELKRQLMTGDNAKRVLEKVLQVALDDEHQGQVACLKMCMDRMLPMSAFEEKEGGGFSGGVTIVIGQVESPHRVIDHE